MLGPIYLRTAGDSVIRTTVSSAPISARGVTLSPRPGAAMTLGQVLQAERALRRTDALGSSYGGSIATALTGVGLLGPGSSPLHSELFWRTGICRVLRFREGSCVLGAGDVVISARSADELGISLGAALPVNVAGARRPERLRVTGIYAVPNLELPYWWGNGPGYFSYGQTTGPSKIPDLDPLVASAATARDVPALASPELLDQLPLRTGVVGVDSEAALEHGLANATVRLGAGGIAVSTGLPALLSDAAHQRQVMGTIVIVAAVQLVLLAIWALGSMLLRSADARRAELRVARLRGFPATSILVVAAAEPAILCLLGAVLGAGGAWGAVELTRSRFLDPAATISLDGWAFAALGVTAAVIAGTLAFATLRLVRSTDLRARGAGGAGAGRGRMVADVALLVLSVVALIALATSGALAQRSDSLASAAPGLIALGTAVVAVQVVLFACRLGVSATVHSRHIEAFLAVRQIVRRPATLREAQVLIIALCLACFAASAWSVARANRMVTARFTVGSAIVATVSPRGVGLEQAVERVDPHGRFAMAAVAVVTPSSDLLAVDAQRLPAVAVWPHGIANEAITATSRALDPPTAPEVVLPPEQVRLAATVVADSQSAGSLHDVDLGLWVFNSGIGTSLVSLGPLRPGPASYDASLAAACPSGCRLAGVGLVPAPSRPGPAAGTIRVTLTGISIRHPSGGTEPVDADLFAGGWRSTASGVLVDAPRAGALGLSVPASAIDVYEGAVAAVIPPMASVADHPAVLPGAVTSTVESFNGGGLPGSVVPGEGLDGNTISIVPRVTASALPEAGSNAAMVDLDLLRRSQTAPTGPDATDQVWLGAAAPADALARLRAAGLQVDAVERSSTVFARIAHSGPALADDFLVLATLVALVVAVASTLGALGATVRQRAIELTALEVGGIQRRVLARTLVLESAIQALTALFGVLAGVVGALMAIPSLPELAGPSVVPLQYGLPVAVVTTVALAVMFTVLLAAAAVGSVLIRRMSPILLRTAPNDTLG